LTPQVFNTVISGNIIFALSMLLFSRKEMKLYMVTNLSASVTTRSVNHESNIVEGLHEVVGGGLI